MAIATFSLVALDSQDPSRLADFYAAILGWERRNPADEDGDWVQLTSPAGATLAFQLAPGHVPPNWPDDSVQVHLDFDVPDLDAAEAEILRLGARKTEEQPGAEKNDSWRVYLDPDGHPFCLVQA